MSSRTSRVAAQIRDLLGIGGAEEIPDSALARASGMTLGG
jgi:hypothetical protein